MKILFVCKYNRFRSQIAEWYFKKINKNKNIIATSRGIFKGFPILPVVRKTAKELGFEIKGYPKNITEKELIKNDLVVIVANNVPSSLFKTRVKKVIHWQIPDTSAENTKAIYKIAKSIKSKIDILVKQLEKRKI